MHVQDTITTQVILTCNIYIILYFMEKRHIESLKYCTFTCWNLSKKSWIMSVSSFPQYTMISNKYDQLLANFTHCWMYNVLNYSLMGIIGSLWKQLYTIARKLKTIVLLIISTNWLNVCGMATNSVHSALGVRLTAPHQTSWVLVWIKGFTSHMWTSWTVEPVYTRVLLRAFTARF